MGVPRLIFHKALFTRRYVECDTLFLRIEVGPHDSQSLLSDFDSNYWYWVYLEGPFRDTAPDRILISHKVFWLTFSVLDMRQCFSGLSWSSWLGFRFWILLPKASLALNNFTFGRTMPGYCGHSRIEISQSVFKHSSLFWSETLFLRLKLVLMTWIQIFWLVVLNVLHASNYLTFGRTMPRNCAHSCIDLSQSLLTFGTLLNIWHCFCRV